MKYLNALLRRTDGQGLVEYAMILGLVAFIAALALQSVGTGIDGLYQKIMAGLVHTQTRFSP